MAYQINQRDSRKKDGFRFNGLRELVWERDSYCCVNCKMTMAEHIGRWKKRLTINHINGIGRKSTKPDNRMENLETLCLKCHGAKDGGRGSS
jgi:5-methylcytosine-specific restriction endonuclease McrA